MTFRTIHRSVVPPTNSPQAAPSRAAAAPMPAATPLRPIAIPFAKTLARTPPKAPGVKPTVVTPSVVRSKPATRGEAPGKDADEQSPHRAHAHSKRDDADSLDPETRRFAQLAPPPAFTPPERAPDAEIAPRARVSMEDLLPQLVKRIAWAGDKRRGSVQMELGAGPHAGTVITVHADEGRVRIELSGASSDALRQRLEAKGFTVER